jgi:flagellar basal-body rod modification protein FlgD
MISSTKPFAATSGYSKNLTDQPIKKEIANFNNFLQLLTTELKYQDPLRPMDPTQTVTQLASFSAVEQAVKTNSLLTRMVDISTNTQASLLIGKTLSSDNGHSFGVIHSITSVNSSPTAIMETGERITITPDLIIS